VEQASADFSAALQLEPGATEGIPAEYRAK
jgi:hypothetical protein